MLKQTVLFLARMLHSRHHCTLKRPKLCTAVVSFHNVLVLGLVNIQKLTDNQTQNQYYIISADAYIA